MTGYTRQSTQGIVDGGVISADDLNNEFNVIQTSFGISGHNHNGSAGNGPKLTAVGIANDAIDSQHYVAGSIDNEHLADDAVTGSKIDSTTTVTAASFVGPLTGAVTGNVTGNVTGDLTGDVTGNVTGDLTGDVSAALVDSDAYTENTVSLSGTTPAVDMTAGSVFTLSLTGASTFTFSNPPTTGTAQGFTVVITQNASSTYAVTWPSSVYWVNGSPPAMTAITGAVDVYTFFTHDGGTTYYGFAAGQNMS